MSKPEMLCPITYFEDNLYFNTILNAKNCWAAYKLGGYNYDFQSDEAQINILLGLVQTIKNVTHVKILIVPTTEDVDVHYDRIKSNLREDDLLFDDAVAYIESTREKVKGKGQTQNDYTTYIIVKLEEEAADVYALLFREIVEFFKEPVHKFTEAFGLSPHDITTLTYQRFKKIEDDIFETLSGYVDIRPLETDETQWLLKRVNFKGFKNPVKLNRVASYSNEITTKQQKEYAKNWTPSIEKRKKGRIEYYRPHVTDVANLFSGRLKLEGTHGISVTQSDGETSYQSYLVLTNIIEESKFPGKEWIYHLQKQSVQVEICIDIENVPYKKALENLEGMRTQVSSEIGNVDKANEPIPKDLAVSYANIQKMQDEISENKIPMCRAIVSICVAGTNKDQVAADVKALKIFLDKQDFTAELPGANQLDLYIQHIPGSETIAPVFIKKLSPFTIASGVFGVNNRVGDSRGYYIGEANGKHVFLYLGQACHENKSPAATIFGDLGFGKSFNANLMVWLHVLHGAFGLVICPKGERSNWMNLPIIGKYVNIVELTPELKNKGKLDPYIMFSDDIEYASELASNIITDLLKLKDEKSTILRESINIVKKLDNPSMLKLVQTIEHIPPSDPYYNDAQMLARSIRAYMDSGTVKLLFGDGSEDAINMNGRLNVIMLNGITFPDQDTPKENYSEEERIASILMYQIANFSRKFVHMHPGIFKLIFVDESWMLKLIPAGNKLIKEVARLGRSLYATILLNGHSVLDLPSEELQTTITYKFCFHTNSYDEARRMLEYLHLEDTPQNIRILMNLENGECLFSDLYGRVAKLRFNALYADLIEFFKTTPEDAKTTNNKPVPATVLQEPEPEPEPQELAPEPQETLIYTESEDDFDSESTRAILLLSRINALLQLESKV